MKVSKDDMLLYVVTTRNYLNNNSLRDECIEILKGGATFLQLREKNISFDKYVELGLELKELADRFNVPFVINDNVEVAKAVNSDGVHLGQKDMSIEKARSILGNEKIIGLSASNYNEAIEAERLGADYIGIGPVFETNTKPNAKLTGVKEVLKITKDVKIPTLVIGGMDPKSIHKLKNSNVDGFGVVSYIFNSNDKRKRTEILLDEIKKIKKKGANN